MVTNQYCQFKAKETDGDYTLWQQVDMKKEVHRIAT